MKNSQIFTESYLQNLSVLNSISLRLHIYINISEHRGFFLSDISSLLILLLEASYRLLKKTVFNLLESRSYRQKMEGERKGKIDLLPTGLLLPKCPQWPELRWFKSVNHKISCRSPNECRGPEPWLSSHCFPWHLAGSWIESRTAGLEPTIRWDASISSWGLACFSIVVAPGFCNFLSPIKYNWSGA